MNISIFCKLLELKNKIIIVIPYLLGTTLAICKYKRFNFRNAALYLGLIIFFNASTTLLRHYNDFKTLKELKNKKMRKQEIIKMIEYNKINMKNLKLIIIIMLVISGITSVILALKTDRFVFLLEVLCFILGIMYSFGTMPISRTPFGEIVVGITKGLIIPLIAVYIHIYDQNLIKIGIDGDLFIFKANFIFLIESITIFLPCAGTIFNIMLASNMCTIREDIKNKRYTLPISIGKRKSYKLYKFIYYMSFVSIPLGIIFKILSPLSLISIIIVSHIKNNIKKFRGVRNKKDAFALSMKNFLLINIAYLLIMMI